MPTLQFSNKRIHSKRRLGLEILESRLTLNRSWFEASQLPLLIDGAPFTVADINVNTTLTVADIDLWVNLDHAQPSELNLTLISPAGTEIRMITGRGGDGTGFHDNIIDDQAQKAFGNSAPISGERYRPEQPLTSFNNEQAKGTWHLRVEDNNPLVNNGTLHSFWIGITSPPDDHGNSIATASPLLQSTSALFSESGNIETAGDRDCFSWTATKSGLVSFSVSNSGLNSITSISLEDSNGSPLYTVTGNSISDGTNLIFPSQNEQKYYFTIKTQSKYFGTGAYSLQLKFLPVTLHSSNIKETTNTNQFFVLKSPGEFLQHNLDIPHEGTWLVYVQPLTAKVSIDDLAALRLQLDVSQISPPDVPPFLLNASSLAKLIEQTPEGYRSQSGMILQFKANKIGKAPLYISDTGSWTGYYQIILVKDVGDEESLTLNDGDNPPQTLSGSIDLPGDEDTITIENTTATKKTVLITIRPANNSHIIPQLISFGKTSESLIIEIGPSSPGNTTTRNIFATATNINHLGSVGEYDLEIVEINDDIAEKRESELVGGVATESARFDYETDTDTFNFKVPEAGNYMVSVSSPSGQPIRFESKIQYKNADLSNIDLARLVNPQFSTTMFLENSTELIVQMISRGSVGDYTVTLEKSNDIENLSDHIPDNRSTVSEIILAENARSFFGRIEFAKDSDWIKIKSDKSGRYIINLSGIGVSGLADPFLEIRDEYGALLASNDDLGPSSRNSNINIFIQAGHDYFAVVKGFNNSIGTYEIQGMTSANHVDTNNDIGDIESSSIKSIVSSISGSDQSIIDISFDRDAFRYIAPQSGQLTISIDSTSGLDPILEIVRSNDLKTIASNDDNGLSSNSKITIDIISGQELLFVASGYERTIGSYKIKWDLIESPPSEPDDAPPTFSEFSHSILSQHDLPVANSTTRLLASISTIADIDVYRWKPLTTGTVSISMESTSGSQFDPHLRILSSTGDLKATDDDNGNGLDSLITNFKVNSGETYYIECSSSSGQSKGSYNLNATLTNTPTISDFDIYADEAPASAGLSIPIIQFDGSIGGVIGNIQNPLPGPHLISKVGNDIDMYQVTMPGDGGAIDIQVNPVILPGIPRSRLQPNLIILDSSMRITHRFSYADRSAAPQNLTISAAAKSTFYLQVSGESGSSGSYLISLTRRQDDVVDGSTPNLEYDVPQNHAIQFPGDTDTFGIQTSNTERLRVAVEILKKTDLVESAVLVLKDETGLEIARSVNSGSESIINIEIDTIPGRTIYATVSGYGNDLPAYSIQTTYIPTIADDEAGDSILTARQLTLLPGSDPETYLATLSDITKSRPSLQSSTDIDAWSFIASKNGLYKFAISLPSFISSASIQRYYRSMNPINTGTFHADSFGNLSFEFSARAGENILIRIGGQDKNSEQRLFQPEIIDYSFSVSFSKEATNIFATSDIMRIVGAVLDDSFSTHFKQLLSESNPSSNDDNETRAINSVNNNLAAVLQHISTQFNTPIFVLWLDPVDFILTDGKGLAIGSREQTGNISQIAAAGISNRANLDLVVIPNPNKEDFKVNLFGIGGGRILGGAFLINPGNQPSLTYSPIIVSNINNGFSEFIQLELVFDNHVKPPEDPNKIIDPINPSGISNPDIITRIDSTLLSTSFATVFNSVINTLPVAGDFSATTILTSELPESTQSAFHFSEKHSFKQDLWILWMSRIDGFVIAPVTGAITIFAGSLKRIPGGSAILESVGYLVKPTANSFASTAQAVKNAVVESKLIQDFGHWHTLLANPIWTDTIKNAIAKSILLPSINGPTLAIPIPVEIAPAPSNLPHTPQFDPGTMVVLVAGWGLLMRKSNKNKHCNSQLPLLDTICSSKFFNK